MSDTDNTEPTPTVDVEAVRAFLQSHNNDLAIAVFSTQAALAEKLAALTERVAVLELSKRQKRR